MFVLYAEPATATAQFRRAPARAVGTSPYHSWLTAFGAAVGAAVGAEKPGTRSDATWWGERYCKALERTSASSTSPCSRGSTWKTAGSATRSTRLNLDDIFDVPELEYGTGHESCRVLVIRTRVSCVAGSAARWQMPGAEQSLCWWLGSRSAAGRNDPLAALSGD